MLTENSVSQNEVDLTVEFHIKYAKTRVPLGSAVLNLTKECGPRLQCLLGKS